MIQKSLLASTGSMLRREAGTNEMEELMQENRRLRDAIAKRVPILNDAVTLLQELTEDPVFEMETPLEYQDQIGSAVDMISSAVTGLQSSVAELSPSSRPSIGGPTRRQGQFLAYIQEYTVRNNGIAPSHSDLQRFFEVTPPSINSMLKRLEEKGYISRIPGKARAISLTIDLQQIPPLESPFMI